jgi:hypothetical protein
MEDTRLVNGATENGVCHGLLQTSHLHAIKALLDLPPSHGLVGVVAHVEPRELGNETRKSVIFTRNPLRFLRALPGGYGTGCHRRPRQPKTGPPPSLSHCRPRRGLYHLRGTHLLPSLVFPPGQ